MTHTAQRLHPLDRPSIVATADAPAAARTDDVAVLRFAGGLPGFPGARHFALVSWGGEDMPYSVLTCLDDPDVRFLVTPPHVFFPDYVVDLDDDTTERLGLADAEDALVLTVVSLGAEPRDATANLLGPIVVNWRTREAVQAVLPRSGYGTRVPLVTH